MSVSIYVPLWDSDLPDSFIFSIIRLNAIHCKWVKSALTVNQWFILHSHEYLKNILCPIFRMQCSVYYIVYYITAHVCSIEKYGRETEWIPEAPVSLSSCFSFRLQHIEHNIQDFYCWLYKGKCLYHSNKEHHYFSVWVNIFQLSEMRWETRLPAKLWNQFGAFVWEVFLL